ncbi:unnamed protein product [Ixodes persulcatus]
MESVKDNKSPSSEVEILRANLPDDVAAGRWVEDYGLRTNTSWIVDFIKSTYRCQRMVFHKTWRCSQRKRSKVRGNPGADCPAKIDIKIKKITKSTKKKDPLLRGDTPLPAVIKLIHQEGHTHSTDPADAPRRLRPSPETKHTFRDYFDNGMGPAEAIRQHESKLLVQDGGYALLANGAVNPLPSSVYYWFRLWRDQRLGKDVDPSNKLQEMTPAYAEQGDGKQAGLEETNLTPKARKNLRFKCCFCKYGSEEPRSIAAHLPTHVEPQFRCQHCPRIFSRKDNWIQHTMVHTGELPFKCPVCPAGFRRKRALRDHERSHTGERPFQCRQCLKSYGSLSTLQSHARRHRETKPHACYVCEKTFYNKWECTSHTRIHTGEKPFRCEHCPKAFTFKSALTTHTRQHTREKPFECQLCFKTFINSSNLNRHIQTHGQELSQALQTS